MFITTVNIHDTVTMFLHHFMSVQSYVMLLVHETTNHHDPSLRHFHHFTTWCSDSTNMCHVRQSWGSKFATLKICTPHKMLKAIKAFLMSNVQPKFYSMKICLSSKIIWVLQFPPCQCSQQYNLLRCWEGIHGTLEKHSCWSFFPMCISVQLIVLLLLLLSNCQPAFCLWFSDLGFSLIQKNLNVLLYPHVMLYGWENVKSKN